MDEGNSPVLHRWLSLCRLLMGPLSPSLTVSCPSMGAELYAMHLGNSVLKEGWNAIHHGRSVEYVFIGDEQGRTTSVKPDCEDHNIYHVYSDKHPPFEQTEAWGTALHLQELLLTQHMDFFPAESINRVMNNIRQQALRSQVDDDIYADEQFDNALKQMEASCQSSVVRPADFTKPALDIVNSYMSFEITGRQASLALSKIVRFWILKLRIPRALETASPGERVVAWTDHLSNKVSQLLKERFAMNLTTFYEMTYLASLYGGTALLALRDLCSAKSVPQAEKDRALQKDCYLDEKIAHELLPSFSHPIYVFPFTKAEWSSALLTGIPDATGIYPGIPLSVLRSKLKIHGVGPKHDAVFQQSFEEEKRKEIAHVMQKHSAMAKPLSLTDNLKEKFTFLDPSTLNRINCYLTTVLLQPSSSNPRS